MRSLDRRLLLALALFLGTASPAFAVLERVGPVDSSPPGGSYPAWYQDTTGLTIEFCSPQNAAEVAGGWCLLLPADVPTPPEAFPLEFFDEHFYWSAGASMTTPAGANATLVLAVEAAFAVGPPIPGDQITFGRIRVKLTNVPVTGRYRFIHPYGEEIFDAVAGDRIFFTDDVGIGCGADFSCALGTRIGPFLVPSNTSGGPELAAIPGPVPGKLYIADPARVGPVTTNPLLPTFQARPSTAQSTGGTASHHYVFRIEGPPGSNLGGAGVDFIQTTDFSLQGRVFNGQLAGRVTIDRASYVSNATGQKVDVFATGQPTTAARLPTQTTPPATMPQLSFFDAACASSIDPTGAPVPPFSAPLGARETVMVAAGTSFWGQVRPTGAANIPTAVCVKDSAARNPQGQIVPAYFPHPVTDEVSIASAFFSGTSLSVTAASSDELAPPTLTLGGFGDFVGPTLAVTTIAPPAKVRVISSYGGSNDFQVETAFVPTTAPPGGGLVAVNDSVTVAEDSGATSVSVLANDSGVPAGTLPVITAPPRLGTAVVNAANGTVTYTPSLNANGADSFNYTVTVGTATSNTATASITITPVNDLPVAVANGPYAVALNQATQLPSLIANDTDPDGVANIVAAASLTQPTPAGAAVTGGANGIVTFTATAPGTYTFTYRAQDAAGALSANAALVTVTAVNSDVVVVQAAAYRTTAKRWVIQGTDSVPGQTITIRYADGPDTTTVLGTATADAAGNWILDIRDVTGVRDPTTLNPRPTRVRATSPLGGSGTLSFTTRT